VQVHKQQITHIQIQIIQELTQVGTARNMEKQCGRPRRMERKIAHTHGTVISLAFLTRTIRSSFVAAVTDTRLAPVCSISTATLDATTVTVVFAWLCPYFRFVIDPDRPFATLKTRYI